jgi:hypothetical protein
MNFTDDACREADLRREISMPWCDLCEGKKREEEEECWGFIGVQRGGGILARE